METMTVIQTTNKAVGKVEQYKNTEPYPLLKSILLDVCAKTGINLRLIKSKVRWREVVDARCVYYLRARSFTRYSLSTIGELVNKDHSTVLHGLTEANRVKEIKELYNKYYEKET